MTKMLVEDSSLTAVADAIRTKGETTDQLTFPDGFVSAIDGIQTKDKEITIEYAYVAATNLSFSSKSYNSYVDLNLVSKTYIPSNGINIKVRTRAYVPIKSDYSEVYKTSTSFSASKITDDMFSKKLEDGTYTVYYACFTSPTTPVYSFIFNKDITISNGTTSDTLFGYFYSKNSGSATGYVGLLAIFKK